MTARWVLIVLYCCRAAAAVPPNELQAITLIFGTKDSAPTKWDGRVSISSGKIEKIAGYHFTASSKILGGNSWECSTYAWPREAGGMHPNERPFPKPTAVETIGVTIYFRAAADAELRVQLPQGAFSVRPMDIPPEGGIFPLNALVEVYRVPVVEPATDAEFEDDYPSIAADGGKVWIAWQGYRNEAEQVFLRSHENDRWGERITITEKPADIFMTSVTAAAGKVLVVWSERQGAAWILKSCLRDGSRLGKIQIASPSEGSNLFHRAAVDSAGNVFLVWQAWRGGRSDIYLSAFSGGKWSQAMNLSSPRRGARANDWNPAVVADRNGTVWVAWDGYESGNYSIYLRSVRNNAPRELLRVTRSARFHAHPTLTVDTQNRIWIAYDEGAENWGKDSGFLLSGGSPLYDSRTIKVAVYDGARWMAPLRQPAESAPYALRRYFHDPRLACDSNGQIWLFARPRTTARIATTLAASGGKWEVVATRYTGGRWSELIPLPDSAGRNQAGLEAAADTNGNVYLAYATDHRLWGGPRYGERPGDGDIALGRLAEPWTGPAAPMRLAPRTADEPAGDPAELREREQIAALRQYRIALNGGTYRIYRGDMHRHTDISPDGSGDGSLWDAYRYAMDAADLDYLLITDHQSGGQEYTWWRIEKSADMFHVPGFFTTFYGTERSVGYPNGHRNLMFLNRGVRILDMPREEQNGSLNTGAILYPYLQKNSGISMPHSSATPMGTDWRDNHQELEPVVEIYQGARTSAEHEGAPLAASEKRTELQAGGYKPDGFLWNAWVKGYKLGVQASSDHGSTHTSYACAIAEDSSRRAIMNAIRARHTYGATSNMLLDFRARTGAEDHLQGDIVTTSARPELTAHIIGTGRLSRIVLIRDNRYVYSQEPAGESYDLRYYDNNSTPGDHYYYVRVEQRDGNVAWSSPIWITYRGPA